VQPLHAQLHWWLIPKVAVPLLFQLCMRCQQAFQWRVALMCRRRFFLKEGVVHALEQLAASAPKEEPAAAAPGEAALPGPRAPQTRRSSSRLKVGPFCSFVAS
jgi:hypothetical protein